MKAKKLEYLDHLVQNLTQNNQRILLEKDCLGKLEKSFNEIKPKFKVGQFVFRYLDKPRNALNKDQSTTQIREGDILWDNIPREILKVFTYGGDGELHRYYLDGLPNVSFT